MKFEDCKNNNWYKIKCRFKAWDGIIFKVDSFEFRDTYNIIIHKEIKDLEYTSNNLVKPSGFHSIDIQSPLAKEAIIEELSKETHPEYYL